MEFQSNLVEMLWTAATRTDTWFNKFHFLEQRGQWLISAKTFTILIFLCTADECNAALFHITQMQETQQEQGDANAV